MHTLNRELERRARAAYQAPLSDLTSHQLHQIVAQVVMERIAPAWSRSRRRHDSRRRAYYLSAEFLMGRAVGNNLLCSGLWEEAMQVLTREGIDPGRLEDLEDAALGNGGLGRLAACFLDSAATYNLIVSIGRPFMIISMILNSAFRGYGDTKTPMILNLVMNIVNVIFNFLLIYPTRELSVLGVTFTMFGAGWGVAGAAVATALGMFLSGVMALTVAFRKSNPYRVSIKSKADLLPEKALTRQVFKISLPAMLERICMSSSGILVTSSVATLGTLNIAANSLCLSAESLSYMPAFAFQMAITTLVGQALGAKKPYLAEKFVRTTQLMGIAVMCLTGLGLYIFAEELIGIFTPDQEVIAIAARCLRLMALIQPPQLMAWVYGGALRGAGDTKSIFYIGAFTNWGIRTLFSVLAIRVFHLDLYAAFVFMSVEILVRLLLLYLRYRSGKWKTIMQKMEKQPG